MNNTKYDSQSYQDKKAENDKYKNYILNQNLNDKVACFPISSNQILKERNTPPSNPQDIDTESIIRGYNTPLSRSIGVKKAPPIRKVEWSQDCEFRTRTETREPRINKKLSEKDISAFNRDFLPYDVQSSYRDWEYTNSRQQIKDIQEKILKKK